MCTTGMFRWDESCDSDGGLCLGKQNMSISPIRLRRTTHRPRTKQNPGNMPNTEPAKRPSLRKAWKGSYTVIHTNVRGRSGNWDRNQRRNEESEIGGNRPISFNLSKDINLWIIANKGTVFLTGQKPSRRSCLMRKETELNWNQDDRLKTLESAIAMTRLQNDSPRLCQRFRF